MAKRRNRWAIADKMYLAAFITGVFIEFATVGATFIDGLVVSRILGADAMAAVGLSRPLFSIIGIVSGMLASAARITCSQEIGRGDLARMNRFFSATMYATFAACLASAAVFLSFPRQFAVFFGARGNAAHLTDGTADYLTGIAIGIPALICVPVLSSVLQLDTGRRFVSVSTVISGTLNVFMDYVAWKLKMGLFGIGLATSVANYAALALLLSFFLKKDRMLRFGKPNIPAREFLKTLSYGTEKVYRRALNVFRPIIINRIIIACGGALAMSALSVLNSLSDFLLVFSTGAASALALQVGLYYGEVNSEGIKEAGVMCHRVSLISALALLAAVLIFTTPLANIYTAGNPELNRYVMFAFRMFALQIPLDAMKRSRISYLESVHKNKLMLLLIILSGFVAPVAMSFVLGKIAGVYGVLAGATVSDLITLVAVQVFYVVTKKKLRLSVNDYLMLPDEFNLAPENVISLDIVDEEDIALASEQIALFAKGHGFPPKTGYFAALAFEELAANTIRYGFPVNRSSDKMIDLRVVFADGKLVIRLRDNCPHFDPCRKNIELLNSSDPTASVGIRLANRLAKDIRYVNTFDTNTIIYQYDLDSADA